MGRRRLVRGLAAVTAGALPFALGVGSAEATESHFNSTQFDHTFTALDGREVTCTVIGGSSLFRESSDTPYRADASIFSFEPDPSPADPACTDGVSFVTASYVDGAGQRTTSGSSGPGGGTIWFADNVAADLSVAHALTYFDCQFNCEISFTTRPK